MKIMFKGLRTKIESEQKGQSKQSVSFNSNNNNPSKKDSIDNVKTSVSSLEPITSPDINKKEGVAATINENTSSYNYEKYEDINSKIKSTEFTVKSENETYQTVEELHKEVLNLNHQLKIVIKERNESNEQNVQLHHIIDQLRIDLESEKLKNSSLNNSLIEVQSTLKEKLEVIENLERENKPLSSNNSINLFDPVNKLSKTDSKAPISVEILTLKLNEAQNQLSEKSRQLKIRQQNLLDIKKSLQKEISDHIKTQDELWKLQNQMKQIVQEQNDRSEGANTQNGSNDVESNLLVCDQDEARHTMSHDGAVDELKLSTVTPNPQSDLISTHSRSTASVDEYESNDLQSNCNNNEVNLEYLRNVLYSYMTTTDSETAQHLVKALSVIMNFTPEQAAVIKSAMNTRSLSWLRLK